MQWNDIQGWFDFQDVYREAVEQTPSGGVFVEVGSWLGRSTAFLGQCIKESGKDIRLDAVDTWQGSSESPVNALLNEEYQRQTRPLYESFCANMAECGVSDVVHPVQNYSVEAAGQYADESVDFAFIDGDHRRECVLADLEAYWPKIKTGGKFAGHDIGENDVEIALAEFCLNRGLSYYRQGASWIIEKQPPLEAKVLLGVPHPGRLFADAAMVIHTRSSAQPGVNLTVRLHQTSLLANGFNSVWATALQGDYTHFAMLHADIRPEPYWVDTLLRELRSTGADLVSAVMPIKDERGLTSTAIGHPGTCWSPYRRLTMQEIMQLPATFTAADAGYPDMPLLVNTGCWLADLRNPKWKETDEEGQLKCYFTIRDRILKTENGYICHTQPEDWFFSAKMHENGLRAVATRKVQAGHYSDFAWPNYAPWGTWAVDEQTKPHWNS